MSFPLSREQTLAAAQAGLAAVRERRDSRIEDLVLIGGLAVPTAEAARRLGVCERTIRNYRARLREGAP